MPSKKQYAPKYLRHKTPRQLLVLIANCSDDIAMQLCVASTIWWTVADFMDNTDPYMIQLKRLSRLHHPPKFVDFDADALIAALRKCGFPHKAAKRRATWRQGEAGVVNAVQHKVGSPEPPPASAYILYREFGKACDDFWSRPRLDNGEPRVES